MQTFKSECDLKLFQSSHKFDGNKSINKGLRIINTFIAMIELDYIKCDNGKFQLTKAGENYMLNKFKSTNLLLLLGNDSDVDYNNIKFDKKAEGEIME